MRVSRVRFRLCLSMRVLLVAGLVSALTGLVAPPVNSTNPDGRKWLSFGGTSVPGSVSESQVQSCDLDSTVIRLRVPGIFIDTRETDEGLFQLATIPHENWLRVPGKPMVPEIVLLVACPEFDGVQVHWRVGIEDRLQGYALYPSPRDVITKEDGIPYASEESCLDHDTYREDALYPAPAVKVLHVGRIRDQKVVWLGIYPLRYNGAQRELSVSREMAITLEYVNPAPSAATVGTGPFDELCRRSVLGYEEMQPVDLMRSLGAPDTATVVWASNLQDCIDNSTDYLIIAANRFCTGADSATLDGFAKLRSCPSGFNVSIMNVTDIDTTAAAIRNFIKSLYDSRSAGYWWDGHLGFVALVGDYKGPGGLVNKCVTGL